MNKLQSLTFGDKLRLMGQSVGMSKPKAPGARGIVTGTPFSIACVMIGFSRKSLTIAIRLTMSIARAGFVSTILLLSVWLPMRFH